MNETDIKRMKQDFEAMDQALRFELPYDWIDIWLTLALSIIGIGLILCGISGVSFAGFPILERLIAWALILLIATIMFLRHHRQKAKHPARWRESRVALIFLALGVPLLLIFMIWTLHHGLSYKSITATICFALGLIYLILGISDRARFHYLGVAVPAFILSVAFPIMMLNQHRIDIMIGFFMTMTGILSAAIMVWMLRRRENG